MSVFGHNSSKLKGTVLPDIAVYSRVYKIKIKSLISVGPHMIFKFLNVMDPEIFDFEAAPLKSLLIPANFLNAASAFMKGFSKAAGVHTNEFSKATEVDNLPILLLLFAGALRNPSCGH
jgi:hypothetical protein